MTGEERREAILNKIKTSEKPISGSALSREFQVSRQVIVQDIALLRSANYNIISTPRGYQLAAYSVSQPSSATRQDSLCYRVFHVTHSDEQIADELNLIVDNGGKVLDVFIEHAVYGSLRAELIISCRRHVKEFLADIASGKSSPLKNLTSGLHYHTVEADSEETLNLIEEELKTKGYLV